MTEMDRLAAALDSANVGEALENIPRFIAAEVSPKIKEYRDALAGARDALFADLMKEVVKWELPAVSIAFLAGTPYTAAVAAFLGGVRAVAPAMIDYVKERRAIARNHSFAYLLGLRPSTSVIVQP